MPCSPLIVGSWSISDSILSLPDPCAMLPPTQGIGTDCAVTKLGASYNSPGIGGKG